MGKGFVETRCDPEWVTRMAGVSVMSGGILWILGLIFAILGIIADATGSLGLTAMSWFMLAIVFHLAGLSYWLAWALGVYFRAIEAKKKE